MEEQKFAPKLLAYAKEEKQFQTRNWTIFPRSTFLQQSSLAKDDDCGFEEIPFAQINCNPDKIILGKDTKICVLRFGKNNANGDYRLMGIFNNKDPIFNIIGFDFDYSAYKH